MINKIYFFCSLFLITSLISGCNTFKGFSTDFKLAERYFNKTTKSIFSGKEASADYVTKKNFLMELYNAQIALNNEDKQQSLDKINLLISYLDKLESQAKTDSDLDNIPGIKYENKQVIEVRFVDSILPDRAFVPIYSSNFTINEVNQALENQNISSAKIKYIDFGFKKEFIKEKLFQAKEEIENGSLFNAKYDLLQLQSRIITEQNRHISNKILAVDNLTLTEYLINKKKYDAARSTLDEASKAISTLEKSNSDLIYTKTIKDRLQLLEKELSFLDPTFMERINQSLENL